jgi:Flp pilus assembly protein TadD
MDPLDRLAVGVFHRRDWALVFADDAGFLFVRRDVDSAWVAAHAYRLLSPDYAEMAALSARAQADSTLSRALTSELERARDESQWNARASMWLGLLALARGRAQAALGYLDHVEALAPVTPGLALRQGLAHELLGESAAARRAYRRALRDSSDAAAARVALARLGR